MRVLQKNKEVIPMNRLKCNGKPMLTSIQFYKEADLGDLLRQKEAFLSFASSHLNLESRNFHIFMLQKISQNPDFLRNDEWKERLKNDLCDEPKYVSELNDVWMDVRSYFSNVPFPCDKAQFLAVVTLTILISKLDPKRWKKDSPETLVDAYLGKSVEREKINAIQFGNGSTIELPLHKKPYVVPYDPDYRMKKDQQIATYIIKAASVGTYDGVVLDLGKNKQCKIPRGERILVNVVDNTIVSILPNKLSARGVVLERKADGTIYLNGQLCPHTHNVTAFAIQAQTGQYFWSDQGKLDGNYLDTHPKCGKFFQRIVEVAFSGSYYYLLSANGTIDSNDPIRNTVDRPMASLGALKKELKT